MDQLRKKSLYTVYVCGAVQKYVRYSIFTSTRSGSGKREFIMCILK